ncbi:6-phosphogluconolactonase [Bifidobacterium gallicum]|uniref:6-phosphogluconolactonase n=1 Tax=Bifidobacterium gallicum DSM 20093 = LMG 11596 TaxID=561180 RepID=D1NS27_9BIFI|nr:6-phosphogluconolactonase [Bifidobacterium gallicum]EFA23479.1 6-phosphogluconolactonase [Bifidobacterium gallicum DSM 20093 = LMG 11596]KFI57235.1 6-phosphogluconolactonase [Bifidobacterium gallicum DSM 20093 = LMG 11596]
MSTRTIVAASSRAETAQNVADRFIMTARRLLDEPGRTRIDVAVSGGTDGTAALAAINDSPARDAVDWSRVHIWWGDERFVAADSPERNARAARKALLNTLLRSGALDGSQIHEMPADGRSAVEIDSASDAEDDEKLARASRVYQSVMVNELGLKPYERALDHPELASNARRPSLDIAMFGIGPDGHIASLFPNFPQTLIDNDDILCVGVAGSPKMPPLRLTLTVPMINQSAQVWMIGSGAAKAQAVQETFTRHNDPAWPGSFVNGKQQTIWFTDQAVQV